MVSRPMEIQQMTTLIPPKPESRPSSRAATAHLRNFGDRRAQSVWVGLIVPKLDMRRPGIALVFLGLALDWHRSFGFPYVIQNA